MKEESGDAECWLPGLFFSHTLSYYLILLQCTSPYLGCASCVYQLKKTHEVETY